MLGPILLLCSFLARPNQSSDVEGMSRRRDASPGKQTEPPGMPRTYGRAATFLAHRAKCLVNVAGPRDVGNP